MIQGSLLMLWMAEDMTQLSNEKIADERKLTIAL